MLKYLGILIFIIVTTVAPYGSTKGVNVTLAQNPEQFDFNTANLIEEKLHPEISEFHIDLVEADFHIEFPAYINLTPQTYSEDTHKPPSAA